jgi:glutaredoxin
MLKIIGKNNCPNCDIVKTKLNIKGIEYEYILLEDLENSNELIQSARKNGMLFLPLILKDDELVKLEDV